MPGASSVLYFGVIYSFYSVFIQFLICHLCVILINVHFNVCYLLNEKRHKEQILLWITEDCTCF